MKIVFEDNSFIDIIKENDKVKISVAARDDINFDQITMISIEMDKDELIKLLKDECVI